MYSMKGTRALYSLFGTEFRVTTLFAAVVSAAFSDFLLFCLASGGTASSTHRSAFLCLMELGLAESKPSLAVSLLPLRTDLPASTFFLSCFLPTPFQINKSPPTELTLNPFLSLIPFCGFETGSSVYLRPVSQHCSASAS